MFSETMKRQELFESIIESIDEAIHVVDANGITIFYNKVAAKNDGITIEDALGKHVLDVFPSLNKENSTLLKVIKNGTPIVQQHQSFTNIRGHLIDTVNTTVPIYSGKTLIGAVEVAKDLSTVKQLSQKLIDLQSSVHKQTKPVQSTGATFKWDDIITEDPKMISMINLAKKAANTSSPIMVFGETGTGKELFVHAIHQHSARREKSLIAQNCASLPSTLLESMLFGTKKGSYTGAVDRAGLIELAHRGTLFLDELNTMPLDFQSKLLRVLEDGMIRRLGGAESYHTDVRIIVALNEHPIQCMEKGSLRRDLFYRLNVCFIEIPPLRERRGDIPLLIEHFRKKFNYKFHTLVMKVKDDVIEHLIQYSWPGNVRELEHAIEYAVMMTGGDTITLEHLPAYLKIEKQPITPHSFNQSQKKRLSLRETLDYTERALIKEAIQEAKGNIMQAAKILEIPRQTLQYKLTKFKITFEEGTMHE
ncbi:sigma-54 interaction domain-containing protein [Alkalihalophilus sp. As8PL]|uniref:Sigma-54 interaction domain-containing protein n=1 Tax=Alkalihalophilus sp. As8PL TaxID=3237103 RepID=A0AB39BT60_9BACI